MGRAQRVIGGVVAACGAGCLGVGHSDALLAALQNLDVVGCGLIAFGSATAVAPLVQGWAKGVGALGRQLSSLHLQLVATQRSIDDLARDLKAAELKVPEIKVPDLKVADVKVVADDEAAKPSMLPSKVLHLRNVPADATLDDIDAIFPNDAQPSKIVPLCHKSQALVELPSIAAASKVLETFDKAPVKPTIRNQRVKASFSFWPELANSKPSPTTTKSAD